MRTAFVTKGALVAVSLAGALGWVVLAQTPRALRFEVTAPAGQPVGARGGRLIVAAVPVDQRDAVEPRLRIGRLGRSATPMAAVDVGAGQVAGGRALVVDDTAVAFPVGSLGELPAGDYAVQAVLDLNRDLQHTAAPGNLYSRPHVVSLDPARDVVVPLALTETVPPDVTPQDTEYVRYVRLRSELLSAFHGRPFFLNAAVVLPRGFHDADQATRRYPLRISVGGYGERAVTAYRVMRVGAAFRKAWLADDAPRMLRVFLDGAGPYGDPYQVNSANNGPYGDALTRELIPYVEGRFRGDGRAEGRTVDGTSTGGWVALALHVFYPDSFNGAWSYCPDGVDFRAFQRVNIYSDENAYRDTEGEERPSRRGTDGVVRFTMRHELAMENVLGRGDSWTRSGRQWGAWNAVYGPRGEDGHPVPAWDPVSGTIDSSVTAHWEQYDLRLVLTRCWNTLAPKLDDKLNIWVGEMDDYYLNDAVHLLDDFLRAVDPSFEARIVYGPGQGHCWVPHTERELLHEMGQRMGATS